MSLPVVPVHTISIRGVMSAMIQAIQVGMVAPVVPPGSLKPSGTVTSPFVVLLISSGKWLMLMPARESPAVPVTQIKT